MPAMKTPLAVLIFLCFRGCTAIPSHTVDGAGHLPSQHRSIAAVLVPAAGALQRRQQNRRGFLQKRLYADPEGYHFEGYYNINPKRRPTGYLHVGCVHDISKERRYYTDFVAQEERQSMTVDLCWNFCQGSSGAQFFAIGRGSECYCASFFHDDGQYTDETCHLACDGDKKLGCGGDHLVDMYGMHSEDNLPPVPCKKPPSQVANAKLFDSKYYKTKVPCSNGVSAPLDTMTNSVCQIECEEGYFLQENTLACTERGDRLTFSWSEMKGSASCIPADCGTPKIAAHASGPTSHVRFPKAYTTTCSQGYTLDGKASGMTMQDIYCQSTGQYQQVTNCQPADCGLCHTVKHSLVDKPEMNRTLHERCYYQCDEGYSLTAAIGGAAKFDVQCLATGRFTEAAACRPVQCGIAIQRAFSIVTHKVQKGGGLICDLNGKKVACTEAAGEQEAIVYGEEAIHECEHGYSLDGKVGGPRHFTVPCGASGFLGKTLGQKCNPVSNGVPGSLANAVVFPQVELFYLDEVTYTCAEGYTLDGKGSGAKNQILTGGPEGKLIPTLKPCVPVVCGTPPTISKATLKSSVPDSIDFASGKLTYECDAGYSTASTDSPFHPAFASFDILCTASGDFDIGAGCVNINDCVYGRCGEFGQCSDSLAPSANLINNYKCDCFSGYEVTTLIGEFGTEEQVCTNINDCPKGACGGHRGNCTDYINSYTCSCDVGYRITMQGDNETCAPVSCGVERDFAHASSSKELKSVDFDTPPWVVQCDVGYTLDGTAGGVTSFTRQCTETGALTAAGVCKPINCGASKSIEYADMAPNLAERYFDDGGVVYTCDEGHTLDARASGPASFRVKCVADGTITSVWSSGGGEQEEPGMKSCKAVECGSLPEQPNSVYDGASVQKYPNVVTVHCNQGYSVDGSNSSDADHYNIACQSDGQFSQNVGKTCTKVVCLDPGTPAHTQRSPANPASGQFMYGDKLNYTIDPGFKVEAGGEELEGSYECTCRANGVFDGPCTSAKAKPIDCGPAPTVEHAVVKGETTFGGQLVATAFEGYTLDGSAHGDPEFTFSCQATGAYPDRPSFQRIVCGPSPDLDYVESIEHTSGAEEAGLLQIYGNHSGARRKTMRRSNRRVEMLYGDELLVTCAEGYRAVSGDLLLSTPRGEVNPEDPKSFSISCGLSGDLTPKGIQCLPVTADVAAETSALLLHRVTVDVAKCNHDYCGDGIPKIMDGQDYIRRTFGQEQSFMCDGGQSLDGTPEGDTSFTETVLASGEYSVHHTCKAINWCLRSACGDHGTCSNNKYDYSCACIDGYEEVGYNTSRKCIDIDECSRWSGNEMCGASSSSGSCVDEVNSYRCTCNSGYKAEVSADGYEVCAAVPCGSAPSVEHGTADTGDQILSYGMQAMYTCGEGYSIDGSTKPTAKFFQKKCSADGSFFNLQQQGGQCKPVNCGTFTEIAHAEALNLTVSYPDSLVYECAEGYTTTGNAADPKTFHVQCLADGTYETPGQCEIVSCGGPPDAAHSLPTKSKTEMVYGEVLEYACVLGYSVDGTAEGAQSFKVECLVNGSTTFGSQKCMPISCGSLVADHAAFDSAEKLFGQSVTVSCNVGYSLDGSGQGDTMYTATCGDAGKFELGIGSSAQPLELPACTRVSCGSPKAGDVVNATPSSTAELFYSDEVEWTCAAGYSTTGTPEGATTFRRACGASGNLLQGPICQDIDWCGTTPCGSNGVCSDDGPSYSCDCSEGYEVKKDSEDKPTCSADDCTGDPCGDGGDCNDLSKSGGAEGSYSCTCKVGYELMKDSSGLDMCSRKACGSLPQEDGTFTTSLKGYKGIAPEIDTMTGVEILRAFDTATLNCVVGHSTDGSSNPSSLSLAVMCSATGLFDPELPKEVSACQKITCADAGLPTMENAKVTNLGTSAGFKYGEKAIYQCEAGYTTS
mmetsp:Transcript_93048/g.233888  ORF Transcript_93048/g.233888 Transcript_93048/m.233888 type:complete len:1923 (-) Transcript_93048:10-5778(-)